MAGNEENVPMATGELKCGLTSTVTTPSVLIHLLAGFLRSDMHKKFSS